MPPKPAIVLQQERLELRDKLIETVREQASFSNVYFIPLIFATIIATMGLLTDSTAVVIGAMLIAPLFWPIFGLSVGAITIRGKILSTSIRLLLFSIILVLLLSAALAYLTPISEISSQIEARINPTLLDLIIALASAIVGVVALYLPQFSSSVAGVAISISLLPPLCTAGIGIAYTSKPIFLGAMLLFTANMSAIIFAGIITLYILHFRPSHGQEQVRWRFGILLATLLLILISAPLTIYFKRLIQETSLRKNIRTILIDQLAQIHEDASLDQLQITFPNDFSTTAVDIKANIYLPEGIYITIDRKNQLTEALAIQTKSSIDLQLNILNTLILRRQEDEEIRALRDQIKEYIIKHLPEINPSITARAENISISIPQETPTTSEQTQNKDQEILVNLILYQNSEALITYDQNLKLTQDLSEHIQRKANIKIDLIPLTTINEPDQQAKYENTAYTTSLQELTNLSPTIIIDHLELLNDQIATGQHFDITLYLRIPTDINISYQEKKQLQATLQSSLEASSVDLEIYTTRYQRVVPRLSDIDFNNQDLSEIFPQNN